MYAADSMPCASAAPSVRMQQRRRATPCAHRSITSGIMRRTLTRTAHHGAHAQLLRTSLSLPAPVHGATHLRSARRRVQVEVQHTAAPGRLQLPPDVRVQACLLTEEFQGTCTDRVLHELIGGAAHPEPARCAAPGVASASAVGVLARHRRPSTFACWSARSCSSVCGAATHEELLPITSMVCCAPCVPPFLPKAVSLPANADATRMSQVWRILARPSAQVLWFPEGAAHRVRAAGVVYIPQLLLQRALLWLCCVLLHLSNTSARPDDIHIPAIMRSCLVIMRAQRIPWYGCASQVEYSGPDFACFGGLNAAQ